LEEINSLHPKARSLYRKRVALRREDFDLWSFCWPYKYRRPSRQGPKWYLPVRWDGESRLLFVARQPSSRGDFPSTRDKLFWDAAVQCGLAKQHEQSGPGDVRIYYDGPFVTELVHKKAKVIDAEDLKTWPSSDWAKWFREELSLVKPALVVAMGDDVFEAVRKLPDLDLPVERVIHHGYLARIARREFALSELSRELSRVRRLYSRLLK